MRLLRILAPWIISLALGPCVALAPTSRPIPMQIILKRATEADIKSYIIASALREGISPEFALEVAWEESRYRTGVVRNEAGGTKSAGVFQPNELFLASIDPIDPLNYRENVDAGTKRLAVLLRRYRGDRERVMCAWRRGDAGCSEFLARSAQ